jgi:hypothetical protein
MNGYERDLFIAAGRMTKALERQAKAQERCADALALLAVQGPVLDGRFGEALLQQVAAAVDLPKESDA